MNNARKLDLIVRIQRRARVRRLIGWGILVIFAGSVLVYAQYRHLSG